MMRLREIEPELEIFECPKSGGFWIPLHTYLAWKERQPACPDVPCGDSAPHLANETRQQTLICPESGRLLIRYRVGHGLQFHVDRSPITGGVWLDKGEWEALKSKGLHVILNLVFTSPYQRQVRSDEHAQQLIETFRDRIGAADFAKVAEFGAWLAQHPKHRDICCYLLDHIEHNSAPGATPNVDRV